MVETYKKLDKKKLQNRKRGTATTKDSLKDVVPIQWTNEVLNGTRPIKLTAYK